jgi:hypothetical protein
VAELLREESWWVKSGSCWALPLAFFIIEELIYISTHSWLRVFWWSFANWLVELSLSIPFALWWSTSSYSIELRTNRVVSSLDTDSLWKTGIFSLLSKFFTGGPDALFSFAS